MPADHLSEKRKLVAQGFGWAKTVGRIRQMMMRGLKKVGQMFVLTMAATISRACARWEKSVRRRHEWQEMQGNLAQKVESEPKESGSLMMWRTE